MKTSGLLLSLLLVCSISITAQVITGTILGTATDSTGATVPNATVTATNVGTNVSTNLTTSDTGEFTVPLLQPGTYEVTIGASGFKTYKQTNVSLGVDQKVRIDAVLIVGEVNESVVVASEGVTLQTDASDLNATVSQRAIQSLPNIGRNPLRYAVTVPGVVPRRTFNETGLDNIPTGDDSRRNISSFTVNGSRPISSEILLDGAPNTSGAFNEIAVLPNLDAIGDFKVITNAYSAEFGRAGGGVVQFSTKGGTNDFHGSLYEYIRNTVFNANSFGRNALPRTADGNQTTAGRRGQFNINQFGGSFSGPVRVPKLYNGQDKTFFFVSYEGLRAVTDASTFLTVPTERERRGDFSLTRVQVRDAAGNLVLVPRDIYQPYASTSIAEGGVRVIRQQFAGNVIPQNLINPVGQRVINLYPLPNITAINPDGTQNFFDSNSRRVRTDQLVLRFDQNFSERHRTFFRYTQDWTTNTPPNRFRSTDPNIETQPPTTQNNPSATLGYTLTKSSTSLFDFRANVTRINLLTQPLSADGLNYDLAALGFSPAEAAVAPTGAFPRFEIGGGFPIIGILNFVLRDNHSTNSSFNGSYTKVLNSLTLKVGGEFRAYQSNFYQPFLPSLAFQGSGFSTRCGGSGCPGVPVGTAQGYALADLLTGALNSRLGAGQFTTGDPRLALTSKYFGIYTQNDWKATRKLTLNLGLRWEHQAPLTDRYNRLTNFDVDATQTVAGRTLRGNYDFVNVNGNSRGQTESDYSDFATRVGFAYRPFDRTVIRAAYGISYDIVTGVGSGAQGFGTDGFNNPAFIRIRPATGPFATLDVLDQPFNNAFNGGGVTVGANPSDPRLLGTQVQAVRRKQSTPYIQQWNLTVERDLPGGINLEVAYVGTKGTHIVSQTFPINGNNAIDPAVLADARALHRNGN